MNSFECVFTIYDLNIVYFGLCLCALFSSSYIFCKASGIVLQKKQKIFLIIAGIILSTLYVIMRVLGNQLSQLLMYLAIPIITSLIENKSDIKSITLSLVSLSLYQVAKTLSVIIIGSIFWTIGYPIENIIIYFIRMVLSFVLCVLFMHFKRFRSGFRCFREEKYISLGLAISGIILVLNCINLEKYNDSDFIYVIAIFGGLIAGFGLYLWIRRSITAHYRERLQLKSEEHYQELLKENGEKIDKLKQTNEFLAKVVHRDNHLMNALSTSINAYFESGDKEFKDGLLRDIKTLAEERGDLIEKEQRNAKILPSTGNVLIDGAINDLYIKAAAHGIDFSLTVAETVDNVIGKFISQTELQTLISDHVKDAVIAVEATGGNNGRILIDMAVKNSSYSITVFDNGVEFEADTLAKLGKERVTTHAESGGSGIGFMTTFETLRKSYASLIITEFENKTPFSKSVSVRFDGESMFIIQSYRGEKLKAELNREDVLIL